jgi:uncharacterized protein with NRDE domain
MLGALIAKGSSAEQIAADCYDALTNRDRAPDEQLPRTGVPIHRERELSSTFIHVPGTDTPPTSAYGTRCSTVVVVESVAAQRWVNVFERRFVQALSVLRDLREMPALDATRC